MTESRLNDASSAINLLGNLMELVEPILARMREIRVSAAGKILALRKGKIVSP